MRDINHIIIAIGISVFPGLCLAQSKTFTLDEASSGLPHLPGKKDRSAYPYATAGDRLYAIGDQAGGFPAIGFHVEGQMGGVWQQPIKLLNGYELTVGERKLDKCDSFIAGSFVNKFLYTLPQQRLSVTRTEFVPDGIPLLVVEYVLVNHGMTDQDLELTFNADVNLMPVWLGERSGMIDGADEAAGFEQRGNTAFFKDSNNPWYVGIASDGASPRLAGTGPSVYKGMGIVGKLTSSIHIAKGGKTSLRFYIAGSTKDTTEIGRHIAMVRKGLEHLFAVKKDRYRKLAATATIDIPDKKMMQAYEWGKYSSDWLVREVPGLGRGMSAGLPDYPWFFSNDQAYTFNALAGTVQPDIFYHSWAMLKKISDAVNDSAGRIIHEASTNGVVYDKGRMEESQLYIIAAWNIFRWTGNLDFLKTYYSHGERVWKWLQQHDTDHNSYIEGYGGVEIEGLNAEMLDVQVRTQDFLRVMGEMARVLGDDATAADYTQRSEQLKARINADWWIPSESRYADFISSKEKALSIIDTALAKRTSPGRNAWAVKKLEALRARIVNGQYTDKGYVVYYNTAGILPLEDGMADTAKAIAALKAIGFYTNKFGLYITGIERPDDVRIDEGSFRQDAAFNYGRAVMPAATANLVVAACRYGSPDTALTYIHKILNSFGYATPGTTYEVSPDYGMFVQAWNIRGLNIPIIHYFFGIDPLAYKKTIRITPAMPAQWDHARIKDVLIGQNKLSIDFTKKEGKITYTLRSAEAGWTLDLRLPVDKAWVNGKEVAVQEGKIRLYKQENIVSFLSK
jgi:glycogen debranching enzyme